jgi:hypothetical protein
VKPGWFHKKSLHLLPFCTKTVRKMQFSEEVLAKLKFRKNSIIFYLSSLLFKDAAG